MRKLMLELDALEVETFDPDLEEPEGEGTVLAHAATLNPRSCGGTCILTYICGCGDPTAVDPTCSGEPQCG
ncbi:MAG TPA: hypothetical protein VGO40_14500 [Longimicrobium sp.]|jgi:hypothetical protein|nr:hypothetical protein [Longimicrobium sp.]